MISLSGPLMVLLLALVVGATVGKLPPAVNATVWMEALSRPLGRLAPLLVPVLFGGAALLLGWVNAPDPLVMALSVWLLMIGFAIKVKGAGGFIHELFCAPFGSNPLLWPLNFVFNLVEYISKPLSHSLRLYGNMYAGEIIFLLLWLMAGVGLVGSIAAFFLGLGWAIFHILIVALQAYIFMMLTIVYIQMAHEGH